LVINEYDFLNMIEYISFKIHNLIGILFLLTSKLYIQCQKKVQKSKQKKPIKPN